MAVDWSLVEAYVQAAYEQHGRVERADAIDLAYAENADDDVIDAIDAIGSRVFNTPEDVKAFLAGQNVIEG